MKEEKEKKSLSLFSAETLDSLAMAEVFGGGNTYCNGGNCVTQCGCNSNTGTAACNKVNAGGIASCAKVGCKVEEAPFDPPLSSDVLCVDEASSYLLLP